MQNNNLNYKNLIKYTDKVISDEIKCKITKDVSHYTIETNKIIYTYSFHKLKFTRSTFTDISDIWVYYKKNNKKEYVLYESKIIRDFCLFFTSRGKFLIKTIELFAKTLENPETKNLQLIIDNL